MASMDFVVQVLLRVAMRRSIRRLQEVVDTAVEIGTAVFLAVRVSGLVFRRRLPTSSSPSSVAGGTATTTTTTYFYSPAASTPLIGMSRIDRH